MNNWPAPPKPAADRVRPFFYIQAGRAQVMGGQTAGGVEYLQRGLGLFATRGQDGKVFNVGNRIVGELNQRGLSKEAQQVSAYIKSLMPNFDGRSGSILAIQAAAPANPLPGLRRAGPS